MANRKAEENKSSGTAAKNAKCNEVESDDDQFVGVSRKYTDHHQGRGQQ